MRKIHTLLFFLLFGPVFANAAAINVASYYTQTDFQQVGDAVTRTCVGTPFLPSTTVNVTAVGVKMELLASPTDNVTVAVYSNSSNLPNTSLESGSAISNTAFNTGSYTFATSTFAGTTLINSGTQYWVVACRSGTVDAINNYKWGVSNSSIPYTTGMASFNAVIWSSALSTYNADFEVDGTIVASASSNPFFYSYWW